MKLFMTIRVVISIVVSGLYNKLIIEVELVMDILRGLGVLMAHHNVRSHDHLSLLSRLKTRG